jgi:hypothetical protein
MEDSHMSMASEWRVTVFVDHQHQSLAASLGSGLVHNSKPHRSAITSDIYDENIYQ